MVRHFKPPWTAERTPGGYEPGFCNLRGWWGFGATASTVLCCAILKPVQPPPPDAKQRGARSGHSK